MKVKKKILKALFAVSILISGIYLFQIFVYSAVEKADDRDNEHREFIKKNYRIFSLATPTLDLKLEDIIALQLQRWF